MTDLERFFRRLVGNLAGTDPARLHRPLPLTDIQRDILPYRANRRALELDTSEDYEMVLLRLCAGEGGLVLAEPEEARARFAQELESPSPDLDVLHAFENVLLTLRPGALAAESSFAPPPSASPAVPDPAPPELAASEPPVPDELAVPEPPEGGHRSDACRYCGGALPAQRAVNFCPHCGRSRTAPTCPRCRTELDPGWKHCVNCGAAVDRV